MIVFDRLVSVVLAVILLGLGVLVPVEIVFAALGFPGPLILPYSDLVDFGRRYAWGSSPVRAVAAGTAALGVLLVLAELKRRRPGLLVLRPRREGVRTATTRRSLRQALATEAAQVGGVRTASAKVRRRYARVTAVTVLPDPGDLSTRLTSRVTAWMDELGLVRPPKVRVRIRRKGA